MASPPPPSPGYRLLSALLFVAWVGHAAWMALQHRCSDYFWQRLGIFQPDWPQHAIWIHAASVGEVELIRPLAETLAQNHPVVLSCFTITGFEHARKSLPQSIGVIALPIDFWPISRTFIRRFDFRLALIAETELWPETIYQCKYHHIPLLQINARLSARSLSTRGWKRRMLQRVLGYFDAFLTRNENDRENLKAMKVDADKILLCGNLKYAAHNVKQHQYPSLTERPYLLFASTHAPEETLFGELFKQLPSPPLFIIAPRHPKRANEILTALKPLGLNIRQRSQQQTIEQDTQIYLADTLGEMKPLMAHAKIVIMGGSFNDTGGHNILEPARLGAAIITGPSDDNIYPDIAWLKRHRAIIQVNGIQQLRDELARLLKHQEDIQSLQQNARQSMDQQSDILARYLQHLAPYLS